MTNMETFVGGFDRDCFVSTRDTAMGGRAWCDYISPLFRAELDEAATFPESGGMTNWKIGDIVVGALIAPAQRLVRDEQMIAWQGLDHILFLFVEAGGLHLEACERRIAVGERQVVVIDLMQPIQIAAQAIGATVAFLPRRLIPTGHGHIEALHGRAFDYGGLSVRGLFHAYVKSLCHLQEPLPLHQIKGMSQAAATLCAACFQEQGVSHRVADAETSAAIRRHIHAELLDPSLSVDGIAERFGVSRAALYRLFEMDGGVIKYIRDRRLLRAMKLLTQPGPSGRPRVSFVAYATGFADEKSFSRAFKKRFGRLPRDAQAVGHRSGGVNDNVSRIFDWLDPRRESGAQRALSGPV